jgi:hypothetical protein
VTDGGGLISAIAIYQRDGLGYDLAKANAAGDTLYVLQGRMKTACAPAQQQRHPDPGLHGGKALPGRRKPAAAPVHAGQQAVHQGVYGSFRVKTNADAEGNVWASNTASSMNTPAITLTTEDPMRTKKGGAKAPPFVHCDGWNL